MCIYSDSLDSLLLNSGVTKKSAYSTGNVSKILSVSLSTVINLCDNWVPDAKACEGLESYRVGAHRRIPHHALIELLTYTSEYNRGVF